LVRENRVGVVLSNFQKKDYEKAVDDLLNLLKEGPELPERCRKTAQSFLSLEEGARKYQEMYDTLLRVNS